MSETAFVISASAVVLLVYLAATRFRRATGLLLPPPLLPAAIVQLLGDAIEGTLFWFARRATAVAQGWKSYRLAYRAEILSRPATPAKE